MTAKTLEKLFDFIIMSEDVELNDIKEVMQETLQVLRDNRKTQHLHIRGVIFANEWVLGWIDQGFINEYVSAIDLLEIINLITEDDIVYMRDELNLISMGNLRN